MEKIYKKRNFLVTTIIVFLFIIITKVNVFAAPKIQYSYSSSVTCGTIRYISQITGSQYFNWSYWPASAFGEYYSPGWECGTCSISMALSYIGINKTPKQILEANNGVTYFTGWGATLSSPSVSGGMDNYLNGKGKYSPVIVHFPKSSTYPNGHFVILIDRLSSSSYQVLDCAKDTTWNLSTSSSLYKQIDKVYQYYNPSAVIPADPAPTPTPTGTQTISDGEYHIVSALDNRYALDVSGASKEDRANIDIYRNTNDAKQTFHVTYLGNGYYKIINSNSGKALDAEDYGTSNGTNVIQYRSTNNSNQQWVIKESEDRQYFYIISKCNGLYVDVSNGVASDKNNVQMWTGNKSAAQKWRFIAWGNNTGQTIPNGRYHILSGVETSKGLDVYQGGTSNLTNVQLYKNNRSVNQTFDITYLGSGYYKIIDINSGKSLDVQSNSPVKSANVCIYDYNTGSSESKQWIIKSAGGGWYNIISKGSGLCLDVANGYKTDRTNIQMWTKNGSNAQKWAFVPVRTDNKITFNLNGGTKGTAKASRKIDAYNYGRGAGQLLIYECENFTVTTNKYGREAVVDTNGKVTAIRPYNSESMMTVPHGGFIVSGHLEESIPDSGVKFVDKIQPGNYVGYDLKTNKAYVYNSQNDYLFDFKYVSSGGTYGTLPTPTKSGYDFAGWYTSASGGSRVTASSRYTTDTLFAHWTKQKMGSVDNSADSVNNTTTIDGDKTNHSGNTATGTSSTELYVRRETIYLKKGTKRKISAIVIPMKTADHLVFTSSNSKIATVNRKGVVKAKKAGRAVITVQTPSGIVRNVNVQVMKKAVKVKKVSYIRKKVTLQKGHVGFLNYKVTPWNTTDKMTWTSSKESVITVDDSGRYWTKKKGTSKITIKVGKKKAVFRVKVK